LNFPRYEPKFYEWQALCHVANLLSQPVSTNVRAFEPDKAVLQRREVDGIVKAHGRLFFVEAKSSPQDQESIRSIANKYQTLEYDELLVVAPGFSAGLKAPPRIRLVEFAPNLSALAYAYREPEISLPENLAEELRHGDHHFRYMSGFRKAGAAEFRNQIDKKINSVSKAFQDIRRRPSEHDAPVRVFWSVSRWLFPKDLFSADSTNYLVHRGLVFDIDGTAVHASPCQITPGMTVCRHCLVSAKEKTLGLVRLLASRGFSDLSVVFSGRQGFHVYVLRRQLDEARVRELVRLAVADGIPVDANLAMDPKSVVTFPGSIHGLSMLRAIPVADLEATTVDGIVMSAMLGNL
jgi:hypothetical protein